MKSKTDFNELFNEVFQKMTEEQRTLAFCFLFGGLSATFNSSFPKASMTKKQVFEMLEECLIKAKERRVKDETT